MRWLDGIIDLMDLSLGELRGESSPPWNRTPGLPHCRRILYPLSHQGSPRILEWVAYPFSRGSSWSRNRTRVSCIAGRFFTSWAKVLIPTLPKSTVKLESHSLLVFLYVVFLIALTSIHRWKTCNSFHYCQVLSLITLIIGATKISDAKKRLSLMNYTPSPLREP